MLNTIHFMRRNYEGLKFSLWRKVIREISHDFRSSRLLDFKHWMTSVSPAENSAWSLCITVERVLICLSLDNFYSLDSGPGSSVGIATELRAGRSGIEFRWGRDFPPVQTGPGAHPASCKMGTGSFLGVEAFGACGWPPTPSSVSSS